MKLKDYFEALKALVKKDKSLLECDIVFSIDDEGNAFKKAHYGPSAGHFMDGEFRGVKEGDDHKVNAVCLN